MQGFGTDFDFGGECETQSRLLPRERREVHVAAGEDDTELGSGAVRAAWQVEGSDDPWLEQGGNSDGARRFDDDFHAFPDQAGG